MPNTAPEPKQPLRVAVGLIEQEGRYLLGKRPAGKDQAGKWEFPGGKFEAGEGLHQALTRELHEELGIDVLQSVPLANHRHAYPGFEVILEVAYVTRWQGEPRALEHDALGWFSLEEIALLELPQANYALLPMIQAGSSISAI